MRKVLITMAILCLVSCAEKSASDQFTAMYQEQQEIDPKVAAMTKPVYETRMYMSDAEKMQMVTMWEDLKAKRAAAEESSRLAARSN